MEYKVGDKMEKGYMDYMEEGYTDIFSSFPEERIKEEKKQELENKKNGTIERKNKRRLLSLAKQKDNFDKGTIQETELYVGDCEEVCKKNIEPNTLDHIYTDPPYPYEFIDCWSKLGRIAYNYLKPGGFLVTYSGSVFLSECIRRVEDEGMRYFQIIPLIHNGSLGTVHCCNMRAKTKPIIIFYKPDLDKKKKPFGSGHQWENLLQGSGRDKESHIWGQSVDETFELFDIFSEPGDLILEPFCGGGNLIMGGLAMKRKMIGIDIDEKNVNIVKNKIKGE